MTTNEVSRSGSATPRFELGEVCVTQGVVRMVPLAEIHHALGRHQCGDWGAACLADRQLNDESVQDGSRLMSSYRSDAGSKFWIITESDRSVTTVLLPEEY